jgi:hypothetical protein
LKHVARMLKSRSLTGQCFASRRSSAPFHGDFPLLDVYRKFRALLRKPMFFTTEHVATSIDEAEEPEPIREAPDTSHVVAPPTELPQPRDEALEELGRRLEVMATRADRLERSVEALAPARIAEIPSRAELRAIESLAEATRERGDLLERRLAERRDAEAAADASRAADRHTLIELASTVSRLESKLRDTAEAINDLQGLRNESAESLRDLRDELLDRDSARAAEFSRRLAGAYTVAVVALLATLLTLALSLFR